MKKIFFIGLGTVFFLGWSELSWARPIITEYLDPLGYHMFETQASVSLRNDQFGSPQSKYRTVHFPVTFRLGVGPRVDVGFTTQYITHTLSQPGINLTGSEKADISADVKYAPTDYFGFKAIFYQKEHESTDDTLPIGHGNDIELIALFKLPIDAVALYFNTGYVWRGRYSSQFGIRGGDPSSVEPGNIFENRLSVEVPIRWGLNLLGESAYYMVDHEQISGVPISGTRGKALDFLLGLTWFKSGWNFGTGIGTSVLDENHTSFDLTRGMGDVFYKFTIAYQLMPKKPEQ